MHHALLRIREYLDVEIQCKLQLYCDNMALVKVLSKGTAPRPRDPEYDIINAIHQTRRELPRISYAHVRGHQDAMKKARLTLQETLNVEADALAEAAHEDRLYRTKVPRIANDPVQIHHSGGTITNKLPRKLRTIMALPTLQEYTCKRNEIDPQWIEAVDWQAHWTAIRGNRQRQPFVVKLIHLFLPVRH